MASKKPPVSIFFSEMIHIFISWSALWLKVKNRWQVAGDRTWRVKLTCFALPTRCWDTLRTSRCSSETDRSLCLKASSVPVRENVIKRLNKWPMFFFFFYPPHHIYPWNYLLLSYRVTVYENSFQVLHTVSPLMSQVKLTLTIWLQTKDIASSFWTCHAMLCYFLLQYLHRNTLWGAEEMLFICSIS